MSINDIKNHSQYVKQSLHEECSPLSGMSLSNSLCQDSGMYAEEGEGSM